MMIFARSIGNSMDKGINPPAYFIAMAALEIMLHFIAPFRILIIAPFTYAGVFLILSGIAMNIWADRLFKINKTTVKPREKPSFLITSGPFRISRHPMYLGMIMILFGEAVFLGSLTPFIFPVAFFIVIGTLFIPVEEKNLNKTFGKKYCAYSKQTRKWL